MTHMMMFFSAMGGKVVEHAEHLRRSAEVSGHLALP